MLYYEPYIVDEYYGAFKCSICGECWVYSWEDSNHSIPNGMKLICSECSTKGKSITKFFLDGEELEKRADARWWFIADNKICEFEDDICEVELVEINP